MDELDRRDAQERRGVWNDVREYMKIFGMSRKDAQNRNK